MVAPNKSKPAKEKDTTAVPAWIVTRELLNRISKESGVNVTKLIDMAARSMADRYDVPYTVDDNNRAVAK